MRPGLVSGFQITPRDDGGYEMLSNFLVAHSDHDGNTKVFAAGEYRDVVEESDGSLKFRERVVLLDSFNIQSQLVDPL